MHIANHFHAVLSQSIIFLYTELTTPVQYSYRGVLSRITELLNSVEKNYTIQHYKLTNKHVTEVSRNKRKCLSKPRCLEEIACLSPLSSEKQVYTYTDRAQPVLITKELKKEENSPCELEGFLLSAIVRIDWTTKDNTQHINTLQYIEM